MTAEEITAQILNVIGPLIVTALGALATWVTWKLKDWLNAKVHDARFHCATEKISHFTANAIAEAEQTTVKQLKKDGKWDVEKAKTVRDSVVDVVKRHLGPQGLKELKGCLGHDEKVIEGMIRTQIESFLNKTGNGS